jgi:hypothetical protein
MKISPWRVQALLRKRKRSQPARTLSHITGFVSFLLSVAAFGFSTVAFLNSIKAEDDIRADLGPDQVGLRYDKQTKKLLVEDSGPFTIINSGNRMVAIREIVLYAFIPDNLWENAGSCNDGGGGLLGRSVMVRKPFIVKAGEIGIELPAGVAPIAIAAEEIRKPENGFHVRVCLKFLLATPDEFVESEQVVVDDASFSKLEALPLYDISPDKTPRVLFHKTSTTIFARGK